MKFDSPVARATLLKVVSELQAFADELEEQKNQEGAEAVLLAKERIHEMSGWVLRGDTFVGDQLDRTLAAARANPPDL